MNNASQAAFDYCAPPEAPRRRVAFLNTHPIQYAAPLYAFLNRSEDIAPVALYLSDFSLRGAVDRQFGKKVVWDIDLLAGYEHRFVGTRWHDARPEGFFSLRGDGLVRAIRSGGFDALVLHGHGFMADLVALAAARTAGVPVFYKAETHLLLPRGRLKGLFRPSLLRTLFSQVAGFLAVSQRNAEFYRSLGISATRIFSYPYTVDNDRFIASANLSAEERAAQRLALGLTPDRPVIVYASKLMSRKHPEDLLEAARIVAREHPLQLLIVGTGEMEDRLRQLAAAAPEISVRFAGFKNQRELPAILGASDIFVLPSENEPFGLIVNEAMCAGLPIVASEEIGCVPDLVRAGQNGFTFPARDVPALAAVLRPLVSDEAQRRRMGTRSRDIIADWGYRQNLDGLRAALATV